MKVLILSVLMCPQKEPRHDVAQELVVDAGMKIAMSEGTNTPKGRTVVLVSQRDTREPRGPLAGRLGASSRWSPSGPHRWPRHAHPTQNSWPQLPTPFLNKPITQHDASPLQEQGRITCQEPRRVSVSRTKKCCLGACGGSSDVNVKSGWWGTGCGDEQ